jgi:anti-sigma B factor antagonist
MLDFDCEVERVGEVSVVAVRGELDLYTTPRLVEVLDGLGAGNGRLVIDLTECGFMDYSAIKALLKAQARRPEQPLDLAAHLGLLRILAIAGFQQLFRIHDSRETAVKAAAGETEGTRKTAA